MNALKFFFKKIKKKKTKKKKKKEKKKKKKKTKKKKKKKKKKDPETVWNLFLICLMIDPVENDPETEKNPNRAQGPPAKPGPATGPPGHSEREPPGNRLEATDQGLDQTAPDSTYRRTHTATKKKKPAAAQTRTRTPHRGDSTQEQTRGTRIL